MNWIITFMLKLGLIIVEKGKEWTRGKFSDNGQGTKREVSCFSSFYNFLFTNHNCLVVNQALIFNERGKNILIIVTIRRFVCIV